MDTKSQVLDIAMNLNRIGNWAADGFTPRKNKIQLFLENTNDYIEKIDSSKMNGIFKETFDKFISEYKFLVKEGMETPKDELYWAEKMMTWGNILTHRASLLT